MIFNLSTLNQDIGNNELELYTCDVIMIIIRSVCVILLSCFMICHVILMQFPLSAIFVGIGLGYIGGYCTRYKADS